MPWPTFSIVIASLFVGLFSAAESAPAREPPPPDAVIAQLRDGSRVRGLPEATEVPLDAAFGSTTISLKLVETIAFRDDRETAEVILRQGDLVRGGVGWKALALQTVFGPVTVPMPQVTRLTVVPSGVPPELILWNRLDESPSVVGPQVEFLNLDKFVPGKVGYGAQVAENHVWGFRLPAELVSATKQGTIDFWMKVVRKPPTVGSGSGPFYDFFDGPAQLLYSSDDGHRHGKFSLHGSGYFVYTQFPSASASTDLLGEPDQWNHYAIVWNNDGIEAFNDAKLALLINGKPHGIYVSNWRYSGPFMQRNDSKYLLFHRNRNVFPGTMVYDELRIWNRALTEFPPRLPTDVPVKVEPAVETPRFVTDLRDGSHLLGQLAISKIDLASEALGEMTVEAGQIEAIMFVAGDATAKIALRTDDVLVGRIRPARLPLKTLLGNIEIPVEQIAKIERVPVPK